MGTAIRTSEFRPGRSIRTTRATGITALLAAVLLVAGACSSDDEASDGAPAPGEEAAASALEEDATVIDVRTPEEYKAGHIEGAELINVQSPDFEAGIAELDPDTQYVVYCRTGNRSAQAAAQMRDEGLEVLDGGGMDDMLAAGWPEA